LAAFNDVEISSHPLFDPSIGHMGGEDVPIKRQGGIFDVNGSKLSRTNRLRDMRFLAASR
jgi:hypothetical protein